MHIVLLAAGSGSRMGPLTNDRPKALVEVANSSILERSLRNFSAIFPSANIIIVAGYKAERILELVGSNSHLSNVQVVVNKHYTTSGPLRSIKAALKSMNPGDDLVLGNGDTIFSVSALTAFQRHNIPEKLLVSPSHHYQSDDIQIIQDSNGNVVKAGKRLSNQTNLCQSAGLLGLSSTAFRHFFDIVEESLQEEQQSRKFKTWHSTIEKLHKTGITISAVKTDRDTWWEFDSEDCIIRFNAENIELDEMPSN